MQKFFFILTTILASILGIYIYVGAVFDLYNIQYLSQILIGVFLLLGGISQLIGGPKPHLSVFFIFSGVFIIFLYFIV
ncbi:hypothetical protein [Staphylococcus equorum]|uniref:hypothetical protein n=1 Tax=Staphylococcus equorum TaxID=246432 RepID=UPI003D80898E